MYSNFSQKEVAIANLATSNQQISVKSSGDISRIPFPTSNILATVSN